MKAKFSFEKDGIIFEGWKDVHPGDPEYEFEMKKQERPSAEDLLTHLRELKARERFGKMRWIRSRRLKQ